MPRHIVVDGSNLATEGRSLPSLKQLNEAVLAFMDDFPDSIITVVVDATFGHRIDPREVQEFDEAVENNELVTPPAGAIGRGDAFVLLIAKKAKAMILSNDSFQEFHGEHEWLFDDGRLMGGKPVPHVGWVFVPRAPVRGMISRRATRVAQKDGKPIGRRTSSATAAVAAPVVDTAPNAAIVGSALASQPMPVPTSLPPRGRLSTPRAATAGAGVAVPTQASSSTEVPPPASVSKAPPANSVVAFLGFVEQHPVGSSIDVTFTSYSSHGAYAETADGVHVYVPMRFMARPAPRRAREVVALDEVRTVVIASFNAGRRGIDAALPGFEPELGTTPTAGTADEPSVTDAAAKPARGRRSTKTTDATGTAIVSEVAEVTLTADVSAGVPTAVEPSVRGRGRAPKPQAAPDRVGASPKPSSSRGRSAKPSTAAPVPSTSVPAAPPAPKSRRMSAAAAARYAAAAAASAAVVAPTVASAIDAPSTGSALAPALVEPSSTVVMPPVAVGPGSKPKSTPKLRAADASGTAPKATKAKASSPKATAPSSVVPASEASSPHTNAAVLHASASVVAAPKASNQRAASGATASAVRPADKTLGARSARPKAPSATGSGAAIAKSTASKESRATGTQASSAAAVKPTASNVAAKVTKAEAKSKAAVAPKKAKAAKPESGAPEMAAVVVKPKAVKPKATK
jgi:hypothetical protein